MDPETHLPSGAVQADKALPCGRDEHTSSGQGLQWLIAFLVQERSRVRAACPAVNAPLSPELESRT
jgi:hypothetical protein